MAKTSKDDVIKKQKRIWLLLLIPISLFGIYFWGEYTDAQMMVYKEPKYFRNLHSAQEFIDDLIEMKKYERARTLNSEMIPGYGEDFHIYYEYNKARIDFLTGHERTAARCAELHLENAGKCERFLSKSRYKEYYEYCLQTIDEAEKIIKAYKQQENEQKPASKNTDSDTD